LVVVAVVEWEQMLVIVKVVPVEALVDTEQVVNQLALLEQ
tara:strand:- start:415 stop:534 length:120 start_codon:yes stop_codon:yes gene_type:complete